MALIALWLFFAILVGMFAHHRRNRDGVAWFLAAVVFSPVAAFLVVAAKLARGNPGSVEALGRQAHRETIKMRKVLLAGVAALLMAMLPQEPDSPEGCEWVSP
jgi:hypothetical protein